MKEQNTRRDRYRREREVERKRERCRREREKMRVHFLVLKSFITPHKSITRL